MIGELKADLYNWKWKKYVSKMRVIIPNFHSFTILKGRVTLENTKVDGKIDLKI